MNKQLLCDNCKYSVREYSNGYVKMDFTRVSDVNTLPAVPDASICWTYQYCSKNTKKIINYNINGDCKLFKEK